MKVAVVKRRGNRLRELLKELAAHEADSYVKAMLLHGASFVGEFPYQLADMQERLDGAVDSARDGAKAIEAELRAWATPDKDMTEEETASIYDNPDDAVDPLDYPSKNAWRRRQKRLREKIKK
jgi:hypothetical protein